MAIAVFGFLPVVNELVLGQVTILICAGLYPAVVKDSWRRGIGLGIVLATVPKPVLGPVLVWMLFRRRKALMSGVVVAVLLTSAGIIALGLTPYVWWADALRGAGEVGRHGNISVWTDGMTAGGAIVATLALVAFGVAMRDETQGLAAALYAGLLLAPYTLVYALAILILLIGARPRSWRLGAAAYALPANVLLPFAGTLWLVVGLALSAFPWHEEGSRVDAIEQPELGVSA